MTHEGTLWSRLVRGSRSIWLADQYRGVLPADLPATVMSLETRDRFHAKQGRSTARVRFHSPAGGTLSVYLKRHYHLPWPARVAALVNPGGRHTPASAEWSHLRQAQALGLPVPEAVAAGEWIGPWGALQSFLMVAELAGSEALNEVLPDLSASMPAPAFHRLKRALAVEMAGLTATLHGAGYFHKDLYLCHFFLDMTALNRPGRKLALIDLHRLARHRVAALRWRWKDLGQLLYSTFDVSPIDDRDRLRFWSHYRRLLHLRLPRWQARMIVLKAARYRKHNRPPA